MGDLPANKASQLVGLIGAGSDGDETNPVGSTANLELLTCDRCNAGGLDAIKTATTSPQEVMVGASIKTERKVVIIQPLTGWLRWGFSNTTQSFRLAKYQPAIIDAGPGTHVWVKTETGSVDFALAEI